MRRSYFVRHGVRPSVIGVISEALEYRCLFSTVGYWRFEGGSPGAFANTVVDSSGNGITGIAVNGPTYSSSVAATVIPQSGAANTRSLNFNGNFQRIFFPDSQKLALTKSLTVEAWIYPRTAGGGPFSAGQIFFRGDDRSGLDPYTLTEHGTSIQFHVADANGNTAEVEAALPGLNQWIHVAGELNYATGTLSVYVNGQLAASKTTTVRPFGPLDPASNPGLGIGNTQSGNYQEYFNGLIDEVRVSDVALPPSQLLDPPTATIGGAVFNDTNVDGVLSPGEKGIAGAKVYIDANKNGKLDANESIVTTGSLGNYKFSGLAAGTYRIREVLPAGYKLTAPLNGYTDVVVTAGQNSTGHLFADAPATASISGRVFGDVNGNRLLDAHEPGLGLFTVYLDLNNDSKLDAGDKSTTSDIFGDFGFSGLTAGKYRVRIAAVNGFSVTHPTGEIQLITLSAGQASVGTLFGERPGI